jgi:hypothetical protein
LSQANEPVARQRIKDVIFFSTSAVIILETLFGLLAFAVLSHVLPPPWRAFLVPTFFFVVVTSGIEVLYTVFPMENRPREYVSYRLLDSFTTFGIRLFMAYGFFHFNITLMFWSVVISNSLLFPVMWVRAGLPVLPCTAAHLWSSQVRNLIISFLGPAPVGIYDANYRLIAGLATILTIPVSITLYPYFMGISTSNDNERIGKVISLIVEKLFLFGLLCVGVTFTMHGELAKILLGPKFREGSIIMPFILAGVFLFNIGLYVHKPFEITGRTKTMVICGLTSAAINLFFCFLLIPPFGYLGAAYATMLSYLLYAVCVGYLGRRLIPWRLDVNRITAHSVVILLGIAVIFSIQHFTAGLPSLWNVGITAAANISLGAAAAIRLFFFPTPSHC